VCSVRQSEMVPSSPASSPAVCISWAKSWPRFHAPEVLEGSACAAWKVTLWEVLLNHLADVEQTVPLRAARDGFPSTWHNFGQVILFFDPRR
jgi:hypothetical protein